MNYNALAPLYDRIMSHVEYDLWLKLIKKITATYFSYSKPPILELGGGTGTLAQLLINQGFPYYGSDCSYAMCKEARKKDVCFFCANALKLPLKKSFPLIIFLYDGINYLTSLTEYNHLFNEIYSCLDKEGYFLFDITTETNSCTNFIDFFDAEDFGESSYIRHGYYDKKKKVQYNDFTIYTKHRDTPMLYRKKCEYHAQKIFSVKEILSAVPDNLFTVVGIWDNFSFKRYSNRSERIHFLLQKNAMV